MRYLFLLLGFVLTLQACTLTENIQDGQTAWNLKSMAWQPSCWKRNSAKKILPMTTVPWLFRSAGVISIPETAVLRQAGSKAIEWEYGSEAILQYAFTLKRLEQYDDAIEQFNEYLKEEPYRRPEINVEINACEQAIAWKSPAGRRI